MPIETVSERVSAMRSKCEMIDDLRGGTTRMREKGNIYLPRMPAENTADYTYRLNHSTLYNVLERTLRVMGAKPFSAKTATAGFEGDRAQWIENINMEGQKLELFAKEALIKALAHGVAYLFIDSPPRRDGVTTLEEVRVRGLRPYMTLLGIGDVLGWKSERIAGVETLTEVRFYLTTEVPDASDEFTTKEVRDIMHIRLGRMGPGCPWFRYRYNDKAQVWSIINSGILQVQRIPFVPVYAKRSGFMSGEPPLRDLAELNVKHWQSSSDQDNIMHQARVPILFGKGWSDEKTIEIGTGRLIKNSNPSSDLVYVEHSGAAINSGKEHLADLEQQMSAIGAELLLKKESGNATATEIALDTAASTCDLSEMVAQLEDAFNLGFEFMAEYAGTTPGTVSFFKDFAISGLGVADMDTVMKMQATGVVSKRVVFEEDQRRMIISDAYEWEAIAAEAEEELQSQVSLLADLNNDQGSNDQGSNDQGSGDGGQ